MRLAVPGQRAAVERGFLITIETFDWKCSQHTTQRFTIGDVEETTSGLRRRIAELEAPMAQARSPHP